MSSLFFASLLDCLVHWFWILCRFLARSVAFFVFVRLHDVCSGLGVHDVVRCFSIVLCVGFGFFVASQLTSWLSLFNYIAFLLISVFTALSLVLVLLLGLSHISLPVCNRLLAYAMVTSVLV